jgi:hypothetical protein
MFTQRKVTDICSLQIHGRIFRSSRPASMRFGSRTVSASSAVYLQNGGLHKRTCIFKHVVFMSHTYFVNVPVCYQDGKCLHTERMLRFNTIDNGHAWGSTPR